MPRFAVLFIATWVLLVAPTLCVGGVLYHVCACETDACAEETCSHEVACSHEEDCSSDPCQDLVRLLAARGDTESGVAAPPLVPTPSFLAEVPVLLKGTSLPASLLDRAAHRPLSERFQPLLN